MTDLEGSAGGPGRGTAVVIGGSFAGLLAAWALRGHAARIVLIERDRYPDAPEHRAGVPQSWHGHLLLEAGQRALEKLMPGVLEELAAAGAIRVSMPGDLRWLTAAGYLPAFDSGVGFVSCTRPLLDAALLRRVRAESGIEILQGHEAVGLLGDARAVTGVRVRERGSAPSTAVVRDIHADLVVDASGRTTSVPAWLTALGAPTAPEEIVDAGVAYASRLFHRPAGADPGYHAVYLQTKAPDILGLGVLLPVEQGRWLVSLAGMRGGEPEPGEEGFARHVRQLRDSSLGDLLADAEPAGPVRGFRPGPSVRRHYERRAPAGLVATGDAACTFNPCYGQGMSVAALAALALRDAVARHGGIGAAAAARAARSGVTRAAKAAWLLSSSEDVRFPATTGGPTGPLVHVQHRYIDKIIARATTSPAVTTSFLEVMSLVAEPTALFRPSVLLRALT